MNQSLQYNPNIMTTPSVGNMNMQQFPQNNQMQYDPNITTGMNTPQFSQNNPMQYDPNINVGINNGGGSIVNQLFKNSPVVNNNQPKQMQQMQNINDGTAVVDIKKMIAIEQQKKQIQDIQNAKINKQLIMQNAKALKELEEKNKIHHLVKDINRHLDDYGPSTLSHDSDDSYNDIDDGTEREQIIDTKNKHINTNIPYFVKDSIIIIIVYVIISQQFVKKTLNNYFTFLHKSDGSNNIISQLIYGILLAFLFIIVKIIVK